MQHKKLSFSAILFVVSTCIISALCISGCEKDEIEGSEASELEQKVSTRSANPDIIFYRTSLTTDNFLLSSTRVYQIYNKSKVKDIKFTATTQPNINVNGILLRHYKLLITYKDSSTREINAYSKSASASFTYTPTGSNLLTDSHTAKFLELSQTNVNNGYTYHLWRDVQITPKSWDIKKDGVALIATKSIEPTDKNSNIFVPPHVH